MSLSSILCGQFHVKAFKVASPLPGLSQTGFRQALRPQCRWNLARMARIFILRALLLRPVGLIWVWSCADSGWGPCRWSCTERRSGPPSSSERGASTGRWGCPASATGHGQWVDALGVVRAAIYCESNPPRCAPGRRWGSRTGWPRRCGPLPRCSGPAQAGWCSLGRWCCLCVSSQTGSPPDRLTKTTTKSLNKRPESFGGWSELCVTIWSWLEGLIAHWGSPWYRLGSRGRASLCTAGARSSSPGPSGGVWSSAPWWRSSPTPCGSASWSWIDRRSRCCAASPVGASTGSSSPGHAPGKENSKGKVPGWDEESSTEISHSKHLFSSDHGDDGDALFPHHLPEVLTRVWQGPLRGDVVPLLSTCR